MDQTSGLHEKVGLGLLASAPNTGTLYASFPDKFYLNPANNNTE